MIHCFSIRFRILASIAVVAVMLCYAPLFVTVYANGMYCYTITPERTNDATECFRNANGGAGCRGTITKYAKIAECRVSTLPICTFTCVQKAVYEYEEFQVAPASTWMGQFACLRSLGLSAAGVACIVGVVTGNVGATLVSAGLAESAAAPMSVGIATACGAGAATAFNNWLNNPCCHTYCIEAGAGKPGGRIVPTC